MNFQDKVFETSADLRSRAATLAAAALKNARARTDVAVKRIEGLKDSFEALTIVGREFNKVARRHATRFVKQNAIIAAEAGKEVSALARSSYAVLTMRDTPRKARKPATARKRTVRRKAA